MFSLVPRNDAFFDLFDRASAVMIRAAETYVAVATDYAAREEHIARIRQLEHDGDAIAHQTFDHLDQSFITPFDREDIEALMVRMDNVVDEIDAAAKRLTLYRIAEPTPALIKQTEVLLRACRLCASAVSRLRDVRKPAQLYEELKEIHFLENVGDDTNHAAVAELFDKGGDPFHVMKWKEIYDLTERAIDGCEDIANVIRAIVLKNA